MHTNYLNPAIRQLRDQQVRFALARKKSSRSPRPRSCSTSSIRKRTYTYEYVCYRITNFRPDSFPDLKLTGRRPGTICACLWRTFPTPPTSRPIPLGERVLTVDAWPRNSTSRQRPFPAGAGTAWSAGGSLWTGGSGWGS